MPGCTVSASLDTDALWTATHAALMAGQWGQARALLDALGQRSDFSDRLCSLETYERAARLDGVAPAVGSYRSVLSDRLLEIDWRCERRADGY